jgi:hypothetical protein
MLHFRSPEGIGNARKLTESSSHRKLQMLLKWTTFLLSPYQRHCSFIHHHTKMKVDLQKPGCCHARTMSPAVVYRNCNCTCLALLLLCYQCEEYRRIWDDCLGHPSSPVYISSGFKIQRTILAHYLYIINRKNGRERQLKREMEEFWTGYNDHF